MARLRLTLFALVAFGLCAGLVYLNAPAEQARAQKAATQHAEAANLAALQTLDQREQAIAAFGFAASQSADVANAIPADHVGRARAPTPEAFAALRTALDAAAPEAIKGKLAIVWTGEDAALAAQGSAAPQPTLAGMDLSKVTAGTLTELDGADGPYAAVAFVPAGRQKVTITIAAPVVDSAAIEALAKREAVSAVALLEGGKLIAAGGPLLGQFQKALTQPKAGVVARGPAGKLFGKLALPLFTSGGMTGDQAPLALLATASQGKFQAAAVVPTELGGLVRAQKVDLEAVAGLFGLWLVLLLIPGGGKKKAADDASAPLDDSTRKAPTSVTSALTVKASTAQQLALAEAAPVPETSPDDFQFGPALQGTPLPAEAAPAPPAQDDAFAMFDPAARPAAPAPQPYEEPPEEATRVAQIPAELLQRAARGAEVIVPAPPPPEPMPAFDEDELHFQEIFREFVATRERCGEPADGLTYEKFAVKLRKNRETLVEKYSCRTVRFQVYVKDNKAALKATPVKA